MEFPTEAHARLYEIIKAKSFVRGHVVLASGKESDHYFDMKPSMFDPEGAELLAELIYARGDVRDREFLKLTQTILATPRNPGADRTL